MADKMCEERMFISSEELDGSSVLSDRNFNMTRSLYTNPIWNSKNHLIFMLRDFNGGCYQPTRRSISPDGTFSNDHDALILCFKFIWRFFRGLRTVICWEFGCSRYDHFAENVIWYTGKDQEVYFDFSITNMHGKPLKVVMDDVVGRYPSESFFDAGMMRVQFEVLAGLAESTNATLTNFFGFVDEEFEKNIQAIMENDAFLVTLPLTLNSGNRFVLDGWPLKEKVEFHLVAECLRVHPYSNQFLKNSFLFDKYNERMVRFFESGHVKKVYELDLHQGPQAAHPTLEDEEPRPYSLNDLQLPIISLVLGLILSLLIFVAEMVVEDFENSYVFRLSRRFKNYLSSKTVIWA
ncbi:unnamed protein product [Bemisia tabaci]|uniref:Uncharacterized protein n=1 Tax=Bemisia tabaci TaxID=7038 RepID=A0A9P0A4I3_BEMTA|nr:unnamed protein product [Bemisia tabaci]